VPPVATSVLRKQIASGETGPLYALVGGDDMEKSAVAAEFAAMVDEGLRAFNVERMYGGETKVSDLADSANTLPMMVPRRVVIVLEAEKLFIPKRESKASDEELQRLEEFLQAPPETTTIVFVCGALDMRRRVVKRLVSQAQVVNCGVIESSDDAERWVKVRACARRYLPRSRHAAGTCRENRSRHRAPACRAGARQPVRHGSAHHHPGRCAAGGAGGTGGPH
jgi:DNA polymerase-3 subunit delta